MTNTHKIIAAVVGVAVLGTAGFLFSQKKAAPTGSVAGSKDAPLVVVASITPLADIVERVGGETVSVIRILPPGASEHTYEPTPEAVKSAQNAKLFLKIGYGLDDWTDQIAMSINESLPIRDVSANIAIRTSTETHTEGDDVEKGPGEPEVGNDPHYFLQLDNGAQIAINVAIYLGEADPANKTKYQENAVTYAKQLRDEDKRLQEKLAGLTNKKMVTFHSAWAYFAEHYGLEIAATFEPYPGKEPTPQYVADLIKHVREDKIKVLFTEPQFSSAAIAQVATDLNVMLEPLDPIGGTSAQTQTYLDMIRYNADTVYRALSQ